jgi:hypothetical protein
LEELLEELRVNVSRHLRHAVLKIAKRGAGIVVQHAYDAADQTLRSGFSMKSRTQRRIGGLTDVFVAVWASCAWKT